MTDEILVFRKKLLPYSETFIADQGKYLERYHANFIGLQPESSGLTLLNNSSKKILSEFTTNYKWSKLLFRLGLQVNSDWLSEIKSLSPSLIHAHFMNDGIDAITLGKQMEIPVLTTLHGHDITKHEKLSTFKKGSKYFFKHIDKVIAVSNYIAGHALRKGCPEHKLVQHYIGIDIDRFHQEKNETEIPSLLFVGRLVEKKGCTYLLQAMEKLKYKYPELTLTIVGDGNLMSDLQAEVQLRCLNVDFVGTETAEQIRQRLSQSWLFVAPSITADNGDAEGLGMVFLEAQALQTPVVSFSSGGVVEAVENESTGLLCAEKDVSSLAENIDTLLSNQSLREEFGKCGRERVEKLFDIRKQCKLLEDIYDDVCHQ